MVSNVPDSTDFTTLDLTTSDTGGLNQYGGLPSNTGTVGPAPVTDETTLVNELMGLSGAIMSIADDLVSVFNSIPSFNKLVEIINHVGGYIDQALNVFDMNTLLSWRFLAQFTPEAGFLREMLVLGLGIDVDKFDSDGASAIKTADSMIGFAVMLQFIAASVGTLSKLPLANRAPEALWETVKSLPEEFGLTWALGMTIEKAFESAMGTQLERNIWRQKRPNEPEWPIARTMLKQHVITDDKLTEILRNSGYSEEWIEAIRKLETQPLPIGDIQALYQAELIDDDAVKKYINELGFNDDVADLLHVLYVKKAETAAGSELRSTARALYRNGQILESDYRTILTNTNYPSRLIDDDIAAITLEHQVGWKTQSIAVVKSQYLHNTLTRDSAVLKLQTMGYSLQDAGDQVTSWTAPSIRRTHGLNQSQILRYYVAGLLSTADASTQLLSIGINATTVQFLLDHPTASAGVHHTKLTPALVTQAFIVGAITHDQLPAMFEKAGAGKDTIPYLIATAEYKYAHHHEPGSGTTPLSVGDIKAAFKLGLFDEPTTLNALMQLGYSQANALLIVEIENKGPIQAPQAPVFKSLDDAISYLISLGYKVEGGIDPTYEAALSMVESAGLTPVAPDNFMPPRSGPTYAAPGSSTGGVLSGP